MSLRSYPAASFGLFVLAIASIGVASAQPALDARGQLTRPPRLTHFVSAPYPESARAEGSARSVGLAIVIGADGGVEDAAVLESAGEDFDRAALEAARGFVFEPAEIDGVPARIRIVYRYEFAAYTPPVEVVEPTTAEFEGVVRDVDDRTPIEGAVVTVDDGESATTDAEGRFRFPAVAPGPHSISVSGPRLPSVQTEEILYAGERLATVYDVTRLPESVAGSDADIEILVFAPRLERQAVATEVDAETARRVPGTGGEVVQVVNNLPGVGRSAAGSGAFVVWGAAPEDTGVFVDGVRVPRLYHDGGLRAVMGSESVESVQLVPGGYGASYGRGLGGLVMVSTFRTDDLDEAAASVAFDVYDGSASVRGPVSDRVGIGIAGRASYLAPLLRTVASSDIEDFFPLPHYYDAQARVGVRLREHEWMDATVLVSGDRSRRSVVDADPARSTMEERQLDFERGYVRYGRDFEDGRSVSVVVFGGTERRSLRSEFGSVATRLATSSRSFGIRASHRNRVTDFLVLETGFDAELSSVRVERTGAIGAPPREGDVRVFGQPPPDELGSDSYDVAYVNGAPYVQATLSSDSDRLVATLGVRADPYVRSVSRVNPSNGSSPPSGRYDVRFRAEPRALLRYAPSEKGFVQGAFGLYTQSPAAADLSAVFGNPTLEPATAQHVVVGGGFTVAELVTTEVTAFLTRSESLAMRNRADSPAIAEALVADGEGRAYGAQVLLRVAPTRGFFGWVSYTLMRAERRDAKDVPFRPFDFDQRHVVTAVGGYELGAGFELGARFRAATGAPRTSVTGAYYDARRDLYQPTFGEHNAIRIPTFLQLDLRVAKRFEIHGTHLDLSLEIQNVTNRKNIEELVYNADYSVRGSIRGLPILPVLGLRWSL